MRRAGQLLFVVFALLASVAAAAAGGRVALVIGNSDYRLVDTLDGAKKDAEDVAVMLETIGFDVVRGYNISKGRFRSVLTDFTRRLNDADVALFYYVGQGLQSEERNYLLPIDAEIRSLTDLVFDAVPVMEVARLMQRSAKSSVVLLECCEANAIVTKGTTSSTSFSLGGLAAEPIGEDLFLAMAAQPDHLAAATGERRPFTQSLIRRLKVAGDDIAETMKSVETEVTGVTGGRQRPWFKSALRGKLAVNNAAATAATATVAAADSDADSEQADWERVLESSNPDDFASFLEKHPDGVFASTARAQIKRLGQKPAEAPGAGVKSAPDEAATPARVPAAPPPASTTDARPAEPKLAPAEVARLTEQQLIRVGCLPPGADGNWNRRSAEGLKKYASAKGLQLVFAEPDEGLLDRLREEEGRVCTLSCGQGTIEKDGQCVAITCKSGQQLNSGGKCIDVKEPAKPKVVKADPKPQPKAEKPAKKTRAERTAEPPAAKKAPPTQVSDGCPRGAKRNRNGYCYFTPFCSAANKGLPGTDQCE